MPLKRINEIYPEDIELNYSLDIESKDDVHSVSYTRQIANQKPEDCVMEFTIPRAVFDGLGLLIPGGGHIEKDRTGNLFIKIHILQKGFEREGNDASTLFYINSYQAKNGSKIDINFLKEKINVEIPKNIENGKVLCVEGKGYNEILLTDKGFNDWISNNGISTDGISIDMISNELISNERGDLFIKIIIDNLEFSYQFISNLINSFFSILDTSNNGFKRNKDRYISSMNKNYPDDLDFEARIGNKYGFFFDIDERNQFLKNYRPRKSNFGSTVYRSNHNKNTSKSSDNIFQENPYYYIDRLAYDNEFRMGNQASSKRSNQNNNYQDGNNPSFEEDFRYRWDDF